MKADAYDLRKILGFDRQLFAPLFQRPYVWEKEKQWEPFWSDIRIIAERLAHDGEGVKPHFMGAIVLDQMLVPIGKPDARSIIDGQQRLTTLQLFLAAFRDLCRKKLELEKVSKAIEQLIFNNDPMVEAEEDRFKVWPTNVDRPTYRVVMTTGSPDKVRQLLKQQNGSENSRIAKAYWYFYDSIAEWVRNGAQTADKKLEVLLHTIREKICFVVIDMDSDDDAQVIFETLNARGTPLLPSDLVKNFLFRKAQEAGADVQSLYESYWQPFEKDDGFWRGEMRQGRLHRPRIDLFLQHYLTLVKEDEVSASALFAEFQKLADKQPRNDAEWHLRSLKEHADHFHNFLNMSRENREGLFFYRLKIMDTTTVFSFLLGLYQDLKNCNDGAEKNGILEDLESYLIRRMVCQLTAKDYNRLFLDLLAEFRTKGKFTRQTLRNFLTRQTAESRLWPTDETFRQAWLHALLYKTLSRPRLRMLLEALDARLRESKTENYSLKDNLTVEHLLPQHWEEHYPVLDPSEIESPEARMRRIERRNNLVHTIGNLTLLTGALNPSISNGPFERKRGEILKHSALNLNRFLSETKTWDDDQILERSERLFEVACRMWPHPGNAF